MGRLIIVGSPVTTFMPPAVGTSCANDWHDVLDKAGQPTGNIVLLPEKIQFLAQVYDPMEAELAWRYEDRLRFAWGFEDSLSNHHESLSRADRTLIYPSHEISRRVWHKKYIDRWIEKNCLFDVLLQSNDYNSWRFVFLHRDDCKRFSEWLESQMLPERVFINLSNQDHVPHVEDWIKKNVSVESYIFDSRILVNKWNQIHKAQISASFEHETDRTHFVLRWLNIDVEEDLKNEA